MKAFMIEGKDRSGVIDIPEPALTDEHSVKVQVESCGICGTDLKIMEGKHTQSIGQKRIPGHEFAGVVVAVGAAVEGLTPGDRVVHEPIAYCGRCYACRNGQGNVCGSLQVTGCNRSGGMEELFVAPQRQWHRLPDWITWDQAALIEPYTIAAQVCARADARPGDVMLIHGAGPIGLMLADTAMHMGLTVMVSEVSEGRLALARALGVPHVLNPREENVGEAALRITKGEGPNIVCDCAGLPQMAEEAFRILSPAGRFVPVAGVPFTCDGYLAMRKQLTVVASRLQMHQFVPVIARFGLYQQNAQRMITDIFDFHDVQEAFAYACQRKPTTGKIVLRFHAARG
ncbi:MAG: alcohol dehydrogenase catalytic domain-containing protein [Clostridiales bacterium]|nr:alcohol dehydrogenase catalytic domain-containing protein [Clostridiales bacterium]